MICKLRQIRWAVFNYRFVLVPLAIPMFGYYVSGGPNLYYRVVLIFGIRVAYWTVDK